jgi:hypothetical protein
MPVRSAQSSENWMAGNWSARFKMKIAKKAEFRVSPMWKPMNFSVIFRFRSANRIFMAVNDSLTLLFERNRLTAFVLQRFLRNRPIPSSEQPSLQYSH